MGGMGGNGAGQRQPGLGFPPSPGCCGGQVRRSMSRIVMRFRALFLCDELFDCGFKFVQTLGE
jgi:hypothetical protein